MEYMCTKFGVDSSGRFPDTPLSTLPMPAAMPAWVIMSKYCIPSIYIGVNVILTVHLEALCL